MDRVIKGKYKGYKIVFDKTNKSIQLKYRTKRLDLNGNITSMCITRDKVGEESIHYFEMKDSKDKVYCLLDFKTYLMLMLLGMRVSPTCVLGKI